MFQAIGVLAATTATFGPSGSNAQLPTGQTGELVCIRTTGLIEGKFCFPRAGMVTYVADFGPDGSTPRHTEMPSAINVPTPIDVDGRTGADVIATFRVLSTDQFVLDVEKAPLSANPLPLQFAVALKEPSGTTARYIFGYNARKSTAPGRFIATLEPKSSAAGTSLGIDVATTSAGDPVTMFGQVHTAGPSEAVVDPTTGRVSFSDVVPTSVNADLFFPAQGASPDQTKGSLTVSAASKVGLDAISVDGPKTTEVAGTLDKLAGTLTATFTKEAVANTVPAGEKRVVLHATTTGPRVRNADLTLVEKQTGSQTSKTAIDVELLPTATTLTLHPKTTADPMRIEADADPPADVLDFSRVDGTGEAERLNLPRFARVVTVPDPQNQSEPKLKSAAARITGLDELDLKVGSGFIDVHTQAAAGPFRAYVTGVGPSIDANATNIPACTRFAFADHRVPRTCSAAAGSDPLPAPTPGSANVILLEGSDANSGTVDLRVTGLAGKNLIGKVQGLPLRTEAILDTDPPGTDDRLDKVDVDAVGGRLGLAEIRLTTGPETDTLPSTHDGVLVRRKLTKTGPGQFPLERDVVFARARDVEKVRFEKNGDAVDALLDSTRVGPFLVDVESDAEPSDPNAGVITKNVRAEATDLPTCTRFAFGDRRVTRVCSAGAGNDPQQAPTPGSANVLLLEGSDTASGTVDVTADGFVAGKKVIAKLQSVPRRLEAILSGDSRFDIDTVGGDLGLAEVRLTTGPVNDALPTTVDGVLVRNKLVRTGPNAFATEREVVLARIRQLSKLRFQHKKDPILDDSVDATVDSARTGAFKVDIENDERPQPDSITLPGGQPTYFPPVVRHLRVDASALQRNTRFAFSDGGFTQAVKIHYEADGEIPKLDLDTNVTGSIFLRANAVNVARRLDFCVLPRAQATEYCGLVDDQGNTPLTALAPNITILADSAPPLNPSTPMQLDFIDCKQLDSDGNCGADKDPARFIRVWDLKVRKFAFQMNEVSGKNHVWLDTDRHSLSGNLRILLDRGLVGHAPGGQVQKVHATIPSGFNAQERKVVIGAAPGPTQDAWSGDIVCPPGMDVFVTTNALGINAGLKGPLCDNPDDPNV